MKTLSFLDSNAHRSGWPCCQTCPNSSLAYTRSLVLHTLPPLPVSSVVHSPSFQLERKLRICRASTCLPPTPLTPPTNRVIPPVGTLRDIAVVPRDTMVRVCIPLPLPLPRTAATSLPCLLCIVSVQSVPILIFASRITRIPLFPVDIGRNGWRIPESPPAPTAARTITFLVYQHNHPHTD